MAIAYRIKERLRDFHRTREPAEALNDLFKRIAFGFRNFENYRMIRALLHARRPNSRVLGSIVLR